MAFSPAATDPAIPDKPPHPYRWVMLAGVWILYFSFGLLMASMAPLIVVIETDLGIRHALMGLILGAWPVVYIVSSAPCGALLDRFGPRRMLFISILVVALSALLRAWADDYIEFLIAIIVFGIGGPLISTGAPKVVSLWFTGQGRGLGIGLYLTGNALGGVTALALTNSVFMPFFGDDWRMVFILYAGIGVCAGFVWLAISSHPASRELERELAGAPRTSYRKVFIELLRMPVVRLVLLMGIFILFLNHGLMHWLPTILAQKGMDPVTAGYWAAIPTAFGLLSAPFIPRMATPARRPYILLALFTAGMAATLLLNFADGPLLGLGLIFQGVCRGSMTGIAILTLMDSGDGDHKHVGAASGLYFSAAEVGGALGPMSVGALAQTTGSFTAPLLMMTGVAVILILILARLNFVTRREMKGAGH
jgi:cyanate permease